MVAAFKVTAAVFKVPPGATVPVLTLRIPISPPAPEMVPLVAVEVLAAPILPVTFKVPLITLMLSLVVIPVLESPDKVRVPTPSRLRVALLVSVIGFAMVLAAVVELRINWVASAMVTTPVLVVAPMLKAPPETMVPLRVTALVALPVMVAPVVSEVVPPKVTPPVFKNTGVPERTEVPAKLTE